MTPIIISTVLGIGLSLFISHKRKNLDLIVAFGIIAIFIAVPGIVIPFDKAAQTDDVEVWSGEIVDHYFKDDWDEWHPPKWVTKTKTVYVNGKAKKKTYKVLKPGWTEHHRAIFKIKASDTGWIHVNKSPDGTDLDDDFPNSVEYLQNAWKLGYPTASTHHYENKLQASYSLYKHDEINLEDYPGLPDYPDQVRDYIHIDRLIGSFPNKDKASITLNSWNTKLNKLVDDPENPGKKKSWKQVNIVVVNLGSNTTIDHGYALQDHWENGNKNDYIVSMGMDDSGNVKWIYPFSWTESQMLNIVIRDEVINTAKYEDAEDLINFIGQEVEDKFVRKEMADYEYIQIETSNGAKYIIVIAHLIFAVAVFFITKEN